jgi:glycosyltransferase involved in cell wall biosynthesis
MLFIVLAKILRKNVLIFFRGWEEPFEDSVRDSGFKSFLFRHSYAKADRFVVLGESFKRKLVALGVDPAKPIHVETTLADSSHIESFDLARKLASIESHCRFLFMSRVLREKGVYIAMDAFAECKSSLPDRKMTLVIAGSGEDLICRHLTRSIHRFGNCRLVVISRRKPAEKWARRDANTLRSIARIPVSRTASPTCVTEWWRNVDALVRMTF